MDLFLNILNYIYILNMTLLSLRIDSIQESIFFPALDKLSPSRKLSKEPADLCG